MTHTLLDSINDPKDLRKIPIAQLPQLCHELRDYIISIVSEEGGHFGASLGVVELTVAVHYMFNTPIDRLVWDVGHQAYGHKILTGRKNIFRTNRKYKGISGFPKRAESVYDTFGVGHSSTSISAALGMAIADTYNNTDRKHIAVIGDGAMTAGLAFEGLNHSGIEKADILVILNDNCMSIDPNVGALKEYLQSISISKTYNKLKEDIWNMCGRLNKMGENVQHIAHKLSESLKTAVFEESNFFESLNFRYFGPYDGHDVKELVKTLKDIKEIKGPKVLHVITEKGKGYEPAEIGNTTHWHAPGKFDKHTGKTKTTDSTTKIPSKYQDVFGNTLLKLAQDNDKIVGITPAMPTGSSMKIMMDSMPDRVFDVGIAEQHAVTFSAGLATEGLIPFCNIYSSFMQRAYDQVIHDVAIQNLPVIFCLDRAGLVGEDGATHHGAYDLAYMRCIPNMIVSSPMDENELMDLMYTAQLMKHNAPFSIRYPRGKGVLLDTKQHFDEITIGTSRMLRKGNANIVILSIGPVGNTVSKICDMFVDKKNITLAHCDIRFLKPLDTDMLDEICKMYQYVLTVEDGCLQGGMGSAILEYIADKQYSNTVYRLGIPDAVIEQGTIAELHKECGYDAEAIIQKIEDMLQNTACFDNTVS